jgi:hypothetical protein
MSVRCSARHVWVKAVSQYSHPCLYARSHHSPEVFCATNFSYVFVIFLQIVWCGRSEIRTKEMDSLLRRRNGDHFLCGHVRVRSGLTRRRDHGKYTCCLTWFLRYEDSLLPCLPTDVQLRFEMKCVSKFKNSSLNVVIAMILSAQFCNLIALNWCYVKLLLPRCWNLCCNYLSYIVLIARILQLRFSYFLAFLVRHFFIAKLVTIVTTVGKICCSM